MPLGSPEEEIGGIPFGVKIIKGCLPPDKRGRTDALQPLTLILTYVAYLFFCISRTPINVLQMKILHECNASLFANRTYTLHEGSHTWCEGRVFEKDAQSFMYIFGSLFWISYGICLYFSGIIADTFNPRYFLTFGSFMASFFMVVLGLSNLWQIAEIHFFYMSIILYAAAQSTAWPVLLNTATHWYAGKRNGLFFSLWNTHRYVGSIVGILITSAYIEGVWGTAFFIPAVFVAIIAIVVFLFFIAHPVDLSFMDELSTSDSKTEELPPWLDNRRTIEFVEALKVPGVVEFSACMFFSRMVSFFFLFWRPAYLMEMGKKTVQDIAIYSLPYTIGGFCGGVLIGVLKDYFKKNAIICVSFLLLSIPAILFQTFGVEDIPYLDIFLQILVGIFVEAPYILLSTSVSVDLGMNSLLRRNNRGLATVAAIVEGTGAIGSAMGPFVIIAISDAKKWTYTMYMMIAMEVFSALCLSRMVLKEYKDAVLRSRMGDYWFKGSTGGI
ncbi:glucose-6-phosphate exchanger SLC37A2 [Caerostris darwini]|uniref:Glucose-6-phosphate exchanger SLC37A2 n=1 Tax=Caerostris darwini TaxID=1538125 RepID=A0AAV4S0D9_9ARAC|nr:glucose-6-phosphate exchanger SLC37A2 [Caerostris darwini]